METLDRNACIMMDEDDLLNFSLDGKDPSSCSSSNPNSQLLDDLSGSFPEFVEEELEWLSNKDAFPAVETCLDILSNHPSNVPNQLSPVSVLDNSTTTSNNLHGSTITSFCGSLRVPTLHPVRARTNRTRKRRRGFMDFRIHRQSYIKNPKHEKQMISCAIGRRCQHCQAETTPQWRAGPMGPKTLCNACGVRYKSGRLVPEYRPASSPTFSSLLHSNSHRKVMEMRKEKEMGFGGIMVNEGCGYRVG